MAWARGVSPPKAACLEACRPLCRPMTYFVVGWEQMHEVPQGVNFANGVAVTELRRLRMPHVQLPTGAPLAGRRDTGGFGEDER